MTLTPEQFNKLATKEDLKNIADGLVSKEEFTEFKDEVSQRFEKVENKVDSLENKVDSLHVGLIDTRQKLGQVEEKVDALTDSMSDVLTAIDGLAHKFDKQEMEFVSNLAAHDRFETRITKLENKANPSPAF